MADKVKRICASKNCDRVLRSHCKVPYCKRCREQNVDGVGTRYRRLRDKNIRSLGDEIKYCSICSKQLAHGNKSGICKYCYQENIYGVKTDRQRELRGGKKVREDCLGCGKLIQRETKFGYCWTCQSNNVDGIRTKIEHSPERTLARWRNQHGIIITDEEAKFHWNLENCQICSVEFNPQVQDTRKCLDHDHDTGHYRGTICNGCNKGLGALGDNLPKILERVFHYYVKYAKQKGQQPKLNLIR